MRVATRILTVAAAGAVAVLTATGPAAATGTSWTVLDRGHTDVFGVAYEDGDLHLHVHHETAGELDPCSTLLVVREQAATTVPTDPAFAFLGDAGDTVWILPDANDPELLFAGWGAEELPTGVFTGDQVRLDITGVTGAGKLSLFTVDDFGAPTVLADSGDPAPDALTVTAGGHGHLNWGFTESGWYGVNVTATGTLADGTTVTDSARYLFQVKA